MQFHHKAEISTPPGTVIAFFSIAVFFWLSSPKYPAQGTEKPPAMIPMDESPAYPEFHQFWRKFQRAVEDRDGEFILSTVSDKIHLDFGGGAGRDEFKAQWKPDDPKSNLWVELDKILRLGCAVESGDKGVTAFAPYAFRRWPEKFDAFEYGFVTGTDVRFREKPSTDAKILRSVSWEIMKWASINEGPQHEDWVKLQATDGTLGYIHRDYVRSSIDFRIGFSPDGKGGFQIDFFIAGD